MGGSTGGILLGASLGVESGVCGVSTVAFDLLKKKKQNVKAWFYLCFYVSVILSVPKKKKKFLFFFENRGDVCTSSHTVSEG